MRYYLHMKSAAKKTARQNLIEMSREGLANAVTGTDKLPTIQIAETAAERTQRIYDEAMARS